MGDPATDVLRREPDGTLALVLSGRWRVDEDLPPPEEVESAIAEDPAPARVVFDTSALVSWDSRLVSWASHVVEAGRARAIPVQTDGLPGGAQRLLELAARARRPPPSPEQRPGVFARIGRRSLDKARAQVAVLAFVGNVTSAFARVITGRGKLRGRDVLVYAQSSGAQAVLIVGLVAFLVGLILAFIGGIQLRTFGASLYVADLVSVAMVRELGAMMTAIVLAGRTGAAFAAELGTMRVTQEIDALETMGLSPVEMLVLPRILALTAVLPLLGIYADFIGILGGAFVGVGVMGFSPEVYLDATLRNVTTIDFFGGLFKAAVYGGLVAAAGCFEGLRAGRTARAVGGAATSAVVDGIVLVIAASGLFSVLFHILGI